MTLGDAQLEQIVRGYVGQSARIWRQDRGLQTPMNVVIDVAEELLNRSIAVFWVENGPPEMFSLPMLDPAVVIFSSRYLEVTGYLYSVLTNRTLAPSLFAELTERANLRISAELALQHGDPGLGCYLFIRSVIGENVYLAPATLMDLEMMPKSESYMALWFFALLHELGHGMTQDRTSQPEWVRAELIRRAEGAVRAFFGEQSHERELTQIRVSSRHSLDPEVLEREVNADLFAVSLLFLATARVLARDRQEYSPGRLAIEIISLYRLFHITNNCALAVRYATDFRARARLDRWLNVANTVRLNHIIDNLAFHLADDDPERRASLRAALVELVEQDEHTNAFLEVHNRVTQEILNPEAADPFLLGRLVEHLTGALVEIPFVVEVRRFCGLAREIGVSHPDLDFLEALYVDPRRAAELALAARRIYFIPWLQVADGKSHPLVMRSADGVVAFVFRSLDVCEYFISHTLDLIPPGKSLVATPVPCDLEYNIVILLHQYLDEVSPHLQIIFEGTSAFAERFRQFGDGTFFPAS